MNGYLLDTSTCIFLLRGKRSVEDRLNEIDEGKCYISDVVVAELVFGEYYSDQVEDNQDLTIVTHNRRHFEHIEGLQIEDWAV